MLVLPEDLLQILCPLKLQHLQNKVLYPTGKFPKCIQIRDLHTALNLIYDYIKNLCRQQTGVTENHENEIVCGIGQGEGRHRKYKTLKLDGFQDYDRSSD
jgi:hypothetical protein